MNLARFDFDGTVTSSDTCGREISGWDEVTSHGHRACRVRALVVGLAPETGIPSIIRPARLLIADRLTNRRVRCIRVR